MAKESKPIESNDAAAPETAHNGTPPEQDGPASGSQRRRRARPFPSLPFEDALVLGQAIQQYGAGQRVRRLTILNQMGRQAESAATRALITASNQYGITNGSFAAEWLELTSDGQIATGEGAPMRQQLETRFRLAIDGNQWFKRLYDGHRDSRMPATSVLADELREAGLASEFVSECIETFTVNAKYLGLLRTIAGAERLLTVEHVLDEPAHGAAVAPPPEAAAAAAVPTIVRTPATPAPASAVAPTPGVLNDVCFYITPIGMDGSEERQHADLFMGSLIEPALAEFHLRLVRADQIAQPGLINAQVIQHIVQCPLVIADLSYHNPNVFYELALRHAVRKPIVQIIRRVDRIPFDIQQFRTIVIDTASIYTLVPRLETYRAEIASQIRMALDEPDEAANPLSAFYPGFWNALRE